MSGEDLSRRCRRSKYTFVLVFDDFQSLVKTKIFRNVVFDKVFALLKPSNRLKIINYIKNSENCKYASED